MKKIIRVCAMALVASLIFPFSAAYSQAYPSKSVKIIVPQLATGASDTIARIIAEWLTAKWGQPVVVENHPGAAGNIGMALVAKAPPDGYTLVMSQASNQAINPFLYKNLSFNTEKDFAAVAALGTLPFVVVVHPDVPAKNLRELATLARAQRVTYGSAGNGSLNHLYGVMFNAAADTRLEHVAYRGAPAALTDLMGGHIHAAFSTITSAAPYLKGAGRMRALAVIGPRRLEAFPEIPTAAESGYPGLGESNIWFGLLAPTGTPESIVNRINADVNEGLRTEAIRKKFLALGIDPLLISSADFDRQVKSDIVNWAKIIKNAGITLE